MIILSATTTRIVPQNQVSRMLGQNLTYSEFLAYKLLGTILKRIMKKANADPVLENYAGAIDTSVRRDPDLCECLVNYMSIMDFC
jgi:hypothetical protein